jgi:hypothetical protein
VNKPIFPANLFYSLASKLSMFAFCGISKPGRSVDTPSHFGSTLLRVLTYFKES